VALAGAAALDVTGRLGQLGPARFTLYQLLALVLAAFVVWLLVSGRERLPATPLILPAAAFLGAAALSLAFAVERLPGLVQLASLASSVVLALIVTVLVRRSSDGVAVVLGTLGIAAVLGALALLEWADVFTLQQSAFRTSTPISSVASASSGLFALQRLVSEASGYGIRARVTFGDPNILASFLMTALLLSIPVIAKVPMSRALRALTWVGVAIAVAGLASTYSRGGFGGLFIGLACVLVLVRASRMAKMVSVAVAVLSLAVIGALVFGPQWIARNVFELTQDFSAMNRLYMAQGALNMWLDHPFGVGIDNFPVVYPQYRHPMAEPGIVESHAAYITVLAEMGFLGLLAFLWVLWRFFTRTALLPARRSPDIAVHALAVGAFAATASMCAQAFTYSLEGSKFLWFAIGIGFAAWHMYAEGEPAVTERQASPRFAEGGGGS